MCELIELCDRIEQSLSKADSALFGRISKVSQQVAAQLEELRAALRAIQG